MNERAAPALDDGLALQVAQLRVVRGADVVLDNVSLSVRAGSIHVVTGENGCGKSTLLTCVLGGLPFAGTIVRSCLRGGTVGYVPQRAPIDATLALTVRDFLALSRQRRPVCLGVSSSTTRHIDALLDRVQLRAQAHLPLAALSGGQLQRVLVVNALDPLPAGLDVTSRHGVDALLRDARAQGVSLLLVSHDELQIRSLADDVTHLPTRGG
jgi:zinc transport system ATP-binding protein